MLRPKVLAMVCLENVGRLDIVAMTLRTGELSLIEIVLSAHVLKRIDKLMIMSARVSPAYRVDRLLVTNT